MCTCMSTKYKCDDIKGGLSVSFEFLNPFLKRYLCKSLVLHCVDC